VSDEVEEEGKGRREGWARIGVEGREGGRERGRMRRGEGRSLMELAGEGSSGMDVMRCWAWSWGRVNGVMSLLVVVAARTELGGTAPRLVASIGSVGAPDGLSTAEVAKEGGLICGAMREEDAKAERSSEEKAWISVTLRKMSLIVSFGRIGYDVQVEAWRGLRKCCTKRVISV
jgi:hypothetical protein